MSSTTAKNLVPRPPVIVVMGHIDHGKSTLLDYIRKANVVAGEAGGITQHIGAYEAEYTSSDRVHHPLTFLDTPGHEAFCNIRERGAQAADIAILIVSAEDGVKPQTIEAYKNIQESKVPFLVAITKIDKPNANVEKAKQTLGENEIYVEGWGGDVPCLPISSVTGEGIPELLDMVVLLAEMNSPSSDPKLEASGAIIESSLDAQKGISATLLIKDGTLKIGDFVISNDTYCPIRFIESFKGEKLATAGASKPVRITGWNAVPACGNPFISVESKKKAETMVEQYREKHAAEIKAQNIADAKAEQARAKAATTAAVAAGLAGQAGISGKEVPTENKIVIFPIVIKADAIGSLEGVKHEIFKIKNEKVVIKIVAEGIGDINEKDVKLSQSDPSVLIVGFNVNPNSKTMTIIERASPSIEVKTFKVIYDLSKFINDLVLSKVPKEYIEEVSGTAKVLALFSKEKDRQVVGGKVETGNIMSGDSVKITRRGAEIGRGKIRELQSKKLRVDEVAQGFEFGMMLESKFEVAPGDRIEVVRTVEKK